MTKDEKKLPKNTERIKYSDGYYTEVLNCPECLWFLNRSQYYHAGVFMPDIENIVCCPRCGSKKIKSSVGRYKSMKKTTGLFFKKTETTIIGFEKLVKNNSEAKTSK